jgi:asparagine synthase (glutamine-hydrolysing)
MDTDALSYFLETGYVPEPRTLFADVTALEPGQYVVWRPGRLAIRPYYEIDYAPDPALATIRDASDAVLRALRAAVRRQMIADVPLGAFLSGGIDSSTVVALMQQESSRPVQTFSVRFEDAVYDESPIARRVATHLGTDHHELTVTDCSFQEEDLWRVVQHVGMPFADSSAIPMFVVSRYARTHVKVALSGDGGDEMFAGYKAFSWADRVERLARVPRPALAVAAGVARGAARLPMAARLPAFRQARKALDYAALAGEQRRFRALHWLFSPEERRALLVPEIGAHAARRAPDLLLDLPERAQRWTPLRRRMYSRLRHELAGDMLVKVDRMSMAASLEVRAPFLDPEVAEISSRLPDAMLRREGQGKFILREVMRPYLPAEVFEHPKWGFSIPLHRFVNERFRDTASALLAASGPLRGLVRPEAAARILERGLRRDRDAGDYSVYQATHQLWALMQLGAWRQVFGA